MTVRRLITLLEKLESDTPVHIDLNPPAAQGMGSGPTKSSGSVDVGQIIQKDTTSNPGTRMEKKISRIILTSGKA
tara:strand:- start:20 stop:244 length:225 start_codon:yes stop_codon:yes gene_type:complete